MLPTTANNFLHGENPCKFLTTKKYHLNNIRILEIKLYVHIHWISYQYKNVLVHIEW